MTQPTIDSDDILQVPRHSDAPPATRTVQGDGQALERRVLRTPSAPVTREV